MPDAVSADARRWESVMTPLLLLQFLVSGRFSTRERVAESPSQGALGTLGTRPGAVPGPRKAEAHTARRRADRGLGSPILSAPSGDSHVLGKGVGLWGPLEEKTPPRRARIQGAPGKSAPRSSRASLFRKL